MILRKLKASAAPAVRRGLSDTALYSGLYRAAAETCAGMGVILMLHRVVESGHPVLWPGYAIDADTLDRILKATRRLGFEIISLDEMVRRLEQKGANSHRRRFVCFTSDDGYLDNLRVALPIFRRHQAPFSVNITTGLLDRTLFYWWGGLDDLVMTRERIEVQVEGEAAPRVLPSRTLAEKRRAYEALDNLCHRLGPEFARDLLGEYGVDAHAALDRDAMTWLQARELAQDPLVTIGAHGITHERMSHLSASDSCHEITDGKRQLEEHLGREVRHLAYPFGASDACGTREFEYAARAGFHTAVTTRRGNVFPEHRDFLTCLPRRGIPADAVGLRNALFGIESVLRRQPKFQSV